MTDYLKAFPHSTAFKKLTITGIKLAADENNACACPEYLIKDEITTVVIPGYACCFGSFHFGTFVIKSVVFVLLINHSRETPPISFKKYKMHVFHRKEKKKKKGSPAKSVE
jgi:hypothetical protein